MNKEDNLKEKFKQALISTIRGEVYIGNKDFDSIKNKFANPRNEIGRASCRERV